MHPSLPRLVRLALSLGISAEIYSNLVRMTADLWELCERPEVSLATSWYSSSREEHKAITRRDTWRQTRANIVEAVSRGIPVRAGVVSGIIPGQRSEDAERELRTRTRGGPAGRDGDAVPHDPVAGDGERAYGGAGRDTGAGAGSAAGLPARTDGTPDGRTAVNGNRDCMPDYYRNPNCSPGACKPRI